VISVVMTAYNAEAHISQAIQGILGQTEPDWELIVVDDGSTDRTREIVEGFADPRIHLVKSMRVGRGFALNIGWHLAKGEYIAIQDADDISLPIRLGIQRYILEQTEDPPDGVGSDQHFFRNDDGDGWQFHCQVTVVKDDVTRLLPLRNPISHTSLMVRRAALSAVGGYDEDRVCLFDWDLILRLTASGHRLWKIRAPLVAHRIHRGQFFEGGRRLRYIWECAKMQARAVRLLKRNPLLYLAIPPLFLYRLARRWR